MLREKIRLGCAVKAGGLRDGHRSLHPGKVLDELLERVDAVFVTTWTSEHERLVAAAAERGVAVFC